MKLNFTLHIRSDYHIGAGHGRGLIDSALLRDGDGTPAIRGSTLAGLLREGLRDLLRRSQISTELTGELCDDAKGEGTEFCAPNNPPCVVCRLLGSPAHPKAWSISSARLLEAATPRERVLSDQLAYANVAQRATVDPLTRRSEDGKLFSVEEGACTVFAFVLETQEYAEQTGRIMDDAALMLAAARMVRQLGRSRRRGRGECRIHVTAESSPSESELLNHFRTVWLDGKPSDQRDVTPDWHPLSQASSGAGFACRILIRTDEPMVVGAQRQSGNQIVSLDHIPGSAVLGAFAALAVNRWKLSGEIEKAFHRVFRRGGVRFPVLYPCHVEHGLVYQSIPWPLDLLTCQLVPKYCVSDEFAHPALAYATEKGIPRDCSTCRDNGDDDVRMDVEEGYLAVRNNPPVRITPKMREEMHVQIDPISKTAKQGQLFGYTSIETGQFFSGQLWFDSPNSWRAFCQLCGLDNDSPEQAVELRVGRAMRRGHGRATVLLTHLPAEQRDDDFCGAFSARVPSLDRPITATFITDTIHCDCWGRFVTSFGPDDFAELIGLPSGVGIEVISQYTDRKTIGSFAANLGLPRWRDEAMRAGSAIGFQIGTIDNQTQASDILRCLSNAEQHGVGLRTTEGFGRICFNHPIYRGCEGVVDPQLCVPPAIALDSTTRLSVDEDAQSIRIWNRRFEEWVQGIPPLKSTELQQWTALGRWLLGHATQDIDTVIAPV